MKFLLYALVIGMFVESSMKPRISVVKESRRVLLYWSREDESGVIKRESILLFTY